MEFWREFDAIDNQSPLDFPNNVTFSFPEFALANLAGEF